MNLQSDTEANVIASVQAVLQAPPPPRTIAETGVPFIFLVELVTKVVHLNGRMRLTEAAQQLCLPVTVVDEVLGFMRTERLCEVARRGETDGDVNYNLTESGRVRALDFFQRSQYAGPCPVSITAYTEQIRRQAVAGMRVTLADVDGAFTGLVIQPHLREQLGAAMNSGRPMFLYGPAGSGKTYLAEHLLGLMHGDVAVPHAVCVAQEVIQVYDPLVHEPVQQEGRHSGTLDRQRRMDERWVLCKRPVSISGGELTLDMLNLHFDQTTRYYEAPPHVKANNGVFVIDDLGRQQVSPQQLMNRWIVPMDRRHDYQALHNGYKFKLPFDVILVFSTNMTPRDIADEAFLRRLGYKIHVGPLQEFEYEAVFRDVCAQYRVPYNQQAFEYLLRQHHAKSGKPLLACYPRDLVGQIRDFAIYRGGEPQLTHEALDWAWNNYFATHEIRA